MCDCVMFEEDCSVRIEAMSAVRCILEKYDVRIGLLASFFDPLVFLKVVKRRLTFAAVSTHVVDQERVFSPLKDLVEYGCSSCFIGGHEEHYPPVLLLKRVLGGYRSCGSGQLRRDRCHVD